MSRRRIAFGVVAGLFGLLLFPAVLSSQSGASIALALRAEVIDLTNREREARGLAALSERNELNEAALKHSRSMAVHDFMAHRDPASGRDVGDRATETGYDWRRIGENIASGQATAGEVVQGWMDSPGHRSNILSPDFSEIGVGYVRDSDDQFGCGDLPCQHYWTQVFAAPRSTSNPRRENSGATEPALQGVETNAVTEQSSEGEKESSPNVPSVRLERGVSGSSLQAGEEVEVTLRLIGDVSDCGQSVVRNPLDIVLVIDRSGSMSDLLGMLGGLSKLDSAKQAAISFLGAVDLGIDRVAVIGFDDSAQRLHELGDQSESLARAIRSLRVAGGTNIADALLAAIEVLEDRSNRQDAQGVIVLLSDGQSEARNEAKRIKKAGFRIVTIGLGTDADEGELKAIATDKGDYYFSPTADELEDIFLDIARDIQETAAATDVVVTHRFDATDFELVDGSITPQGDRRFDSVVWRIPSLGKESLNLSYRLRARVAGGFDLVVEDTVDYLRCGKDAAEIIEGPGLAVQVQQDPDAKPVATIPADNQPQVPRDVLLALLCGDVPWWFIIPLLLYLWLLYFIIKKNRWGSLDRIRNERLWPQRCQFISLAILAYLLFLLGLFLRELQPVMCTPREAIYFWRITEDGESGILYKPISPDLPVREFKALNAQAECVACHTTSMSGDTVAAVTDGLNGPIVVMRLDGTRIAIPPVTGAFVALSPEGDRVAYAKDGRDIQIIDLATGADVPLAGASSPDVIETMPTWAPDGSTIAFVRAVGEVRGYALAVPCKIHTIPASGGVATPLHGADSDGFNYYPAYSPDGRWLAFTRHNSGGSTRADPAAEIFVVPATGGVATRIAANDLASGQALSGAANSWPTWSPDGRQLAFNSTRNGGQFDVFVTEIESNGDSGPAMPLIGVSRQDVFEHLPQWGRPPRPNFLAGILALWPWLIPLVLLGLLAKYLCQPRQYPHTLALARKVTPKSGRVGKVFNVSLTLSGDRVDCAEVRVRKPLDVVMVLDISSSMASVEERPSGGSKLEAAISSTRLFADLMDAARDRVGVVAFNNQALVLHALDADRSRFDEVIGDLRADGGTAIDAGLTAAHDELAYSRRVDAASVIVLLSDGASDSGVALEQAIRVRAAGTRLITVGVEVDEGGESLLRELASDPDDFHRSTSNQELRRVFRSIAEQILQVPAATDVVLVHRANVDRFDLDVESIIPHPESIENGKITWHLSELSTNRRTFRYKARAQSAGDGLNLDLGDDINYLRCGDKPKEVKAPPGLSVEVRARKDLPPPVERRELPPPLELPQPESVWDPDPALILGFGHLGRQVLTHVKKNLRDAGMGRVSSQNCFILLDTAKYLRTGKPWEFAGVRLGDEEVMVLDENLRPVVTEFLDDAESHPELAEWFPAESYTGAAQVQAVAEGTHGSRPLARAAFLRQLSGKSEDRRNGALRQMLKEALERVKTEQHGVRVVLTGSLSEGMSGVLTDLAHLVRDVAHKELGESVVVAVEGYLTMTVNSNPGIGVSNEELNAMAALEELTWFQLNPGMPFQFTRGDEADGSPSPLSVRLIDDPHVLAMRPGNTPDQMSATVADLITLRLDRPGRMVEDVDWYDARRVEIGVREKSGRQLHYGTGGSFSVRLPAFDIIETVKLRWARTMLHSFLMGSDAEEISFDSRLARDHGLLPDPAAMAWHFLGGETSIGEGLVAPRVLTDVLAPLIEGHVNEMIDTNQAELAELQPYLVKYMQFILIGTSHEDTEYPRAGKIGYSLNFLEKLKNECDTRLPAQIERAKLAGIPNQKLAAWAQAGDALRAAIGYCLIQVRESRDFIVELDRTLEERLQSSYESRKQMDALPSRAYIWRQDATSADENFESPPDLSNAWYASICEVVHPRDFGEYLTWTISSDQHLDLDLLGPRSERDHDPDNGATDRAGNSIDEFVEQLLRFADAQVRPLWHDQASLAMHSKQALAVLAEYAKTENLNDYNALISHIKKQAQPGCDSSLLYSSTMMPGGGGMRRRAALAAPAMKNSLLEALSSAIPANEQVGGASERLVRLQLSDPLSWQLVRTIDVMSPVALQRYDAMRSRLFTEDSGRSVHLWSARAKQMTNSLDGILLHPVVAASLSSLPRALLYALAYASGWVRGAGSEWSLEFPNATDGDQTELNWRRAEGWDGAVYGLLHFTYRATEDSVAAVSAALEDSASDMESGWENIARQRVRQYAQADQLDMQSLQALAWHAVRRKLLKRRDGSK